MWLQFTDGIWFLNQKLFCNLLSSKLFQPYIHDIVFINVYDPCNYIQIVLWCVCRIAWKLSIWYVLNSYVCEMQKDPVRCTWLLQDIYFLNLFVFVSINYVTSHFYSRLQLEHFLVVSTTGKALILCRYGDIDVCKLLLFYWSYDSYCLLYCHWHKSYVMDTEFCPSSWTTFQMLDVMN